MKQINEKLSSEKGVGRLVGDLLDIGVGVKTHSSHLDGELEEVIQTAIR